MSSQLEQEIIAKYRAGKLVEKSNKVAPLRGKGLRSFNVFVDNEFFEVDVEEIGGMQVVTGARSTSAGVLPKPLSPPPPPAAPSYAPPSPAFTSPPAPAAQPVSAVKKAVKKADTGGASVIEAPMPGTIFKIEKEEGASVKQGETVIVLEAMKMENLLIAPIDGTIKEIKVKAGESVANGDLLVILE